ncbi:hypothetical protein ACWEKT_00760 [Nocardia takedensis]|uniref:hypothetical protein n=1 Tax=Nocardia takedensis TaxID=259390 RepID=UPI0012F6A4E7|nr:hypothetical protein [Nocardia takedensis]
MKRTRLILATAAIILAGAGALDILGDQSVPTDRIEIAGISHDMSESRTGYIAVPRTVSCPIDASDVAGH